MAHAQTKIKAKKIEKIKKEYYDFIRSFKERVDKAGEWEIASILTNKTTTKQTK
jgi:hypothetical protein